MVHGPYVLAEARSKIQRAAGAINASSGSVEPLDRVSTEAVHASLRNNDGLST